MSNSSRYFLVLFLIFLASSFASNARPIDDSRKDPAKNFQFSAKNDERSSVARVSINSEPAVPDRYAATEKSVSFTEKKVYEDKQTIRDEKQVSKIHQKSREPEASPVVQIKPLAAVSWELPQRKHGEKQPGFNLDYAPPKTHPPVHN